MPQKMAPRTFERMASHDSCRRGLGLGTERQTNKGSPAKQPGLDEVLVSSSSSACKSHRSAAYQPRRARKR